MKHTRSGMYTKSNSKATGGIKKIAH